MKFADKQWDFSDLDDVCATILYSTVQESRHLWSYDTKTLRRAFVDAGFRSLVSIDRMTDPRISVGAWYSAGMTDLNHEAQAR